MYNVPLPSFRNLIKSYVLKDVDDGKLSKPWKLNNKQSSVFFSRSSYSLLYLVQLLEKNLNKDQIIWLPNYFCNYAVKLLINEGSKIFYYPVLDDFKPDWLTINQVISENKPDVFVLVHYFGIINDISNSAIFCKNNRCVFVEDSAHVMVPYGDIGKYSDYTFYSIHKHLAVPDGSVLISNLKNPKFISNNIFSDPNNINLFLKKYKKRQSNIKWVLKRLIQKVISSSVISKFKNKSNKNINHGSAEISSISRKLIQLDTKNICEYQIKIKKNFSFIKTSCLGKLEAIFYDYKKINLINPYWFIIDLKNIDNLKKYNKSLKLHYNILDWIDLPEEVFRKKVLNKDIINRSKELLFIPIHQNVKKNHLKKISSFINNKNILKIEDNFILEWLNNDLTLWSELLNKSIKPNLNQTYEYGLVKSSEGWLIKRGLIKKNDKNFAIFQLLNKKVLGINFIRINRGPLFFDRNISSYEKIKTLQLIKKSFNNMGIKILFFAPNLKNDLDNNNILSSLNFLRRNINPWGSSTINLNLSTEILRTNLKSKWRNQLVTSEKNNLNFHISQSKTSLDFILKQYSFMIKSGKFKGVNQEFYNELFKLNPLNFFILKISHDDHFIASALFLKNSSTIVYQIGWSNEIGRKLYAMNFLMWNAIIYMKKNKFKIFDLGGINKNTTEGIIKFKDGVGGDRYELVGEYLKIFI